MKRTNHKLLALLLAGAMVFTLTPAPLALAMGNTVYVASTGDDNGDGMGPRLTHKKGGLRQAFPFLIPSVIGFAVFTIFPMITLLFVSVTDWDGLSELTLFSNFGGFMREFFVGLQNYVEIFTTPELYQVLGNTLKYVVLYMPLMLVLTMCMGEKANAKQNTCSI